MATDAALLDWLLDTDPTLRWQVERDLAGAPPTVWQATRARVATEGFGAAMLAHQDEDGQWAGGAYFPKAFVEQMQAREREQAAAAPTDSSTSEAASAGDAAASGADDASTADDSPSSDAEPEQDSAWSGQPYTATTWSLVALREWGLDAAALDGTAEKLAANSRWEYEDLPYWDGEVDCCINGFTLANGAWLGVDMSDLARWFVEHQQPEGGWNCEWVEGSTRASFHSTLNSVKGLLAWQCLTGGDEAVTAARHAGEEYLLQRRLLYRATTGERVGPWVDCFAYPFRWVYTALNAADHFRAASLADGTPPDPRMADAVAVIRDARQPDGRWLQERRHPGEAWFEVDVPVGEPSPWLTFFATRVLDWWDAAQPVGTTTRPR
ncbi:squalene cyclase [Tersicoccus sp. MR15.9]|uniref:squalene cyclase n=1 Tax=Tersicoccus mangrovi TaxID=3121635 RepID=UPI002FE6185E